MDKAKMVKEIMAGKPMRESVEGRLKARKCTLCQWGFAPPGWTHCRSCTNRLVAIRRDDRERKRAYSWKYRLFVVAHWRGCMVGFYQQPGTNALAIRPLTKELEQVPPDKLVNLDTYCAGYSREQVAKFKRYVRRFYPHLPTAAAVLLV